MNIGRRFRAALLANVLIGLIGYGLAEHQPLLLLCALAASGAGWWITEVHSVRKGWAGLPRALSSVILVIMLGVAISRALNGTEMVSAFSGFLAAIVVLKLWEKREMRDYGQLLTLSLFMTVGATLTDNSLLIGLVLVVQLPVLLVSVMLFQLYSARERARAGGGLAAVEASGKGLEWATMRRGFFRMSVLTLVASAGIGLVVFLLIPRGIGLREWGSFGQPRMGRTAGFSEEVEPGVGNIISASQVTVMDVKFSTERGSIGGPDRVFYLRGAVLDSYVAGRHAWIRTQSIDRQTMGTRLSSGQSHVLDSETAPTGLLIHQDVSVHQAASNDSPLFALYRPVSVELGSADDPQDVIYDSLTGGIIRRGNGARLAYRVSSVMDPPTPQVIERAPNISFPSEQVRALAKDLLARANYDVDPANRPILQDAPAARVFETYLRNNFQYALDGLMPPVKTDPTEWFLFTAQRGHCEYFASGLAALCRSAGIDARVVAGYLVSEFDPETKSYSVRGSDAHAWVEVNTGPGGWQRFDATPAQGIRTQESRTSFLARMGRLLDSVQEHWNSTIVGFDQSTQEKLLGRQGLDQRSVVDRATEFIRHRLARVRWARIGWWSGLEVAIWVGIPLLGLGALWVGGRSVARRLERRPGDGWAMMGAEKKTYRELLAELSRRGFIKPDWMPPLQFLRQVQLRDAALAAAAGEVVASLYRSRFGGGGDADVSSARRQLAQVRDRQSV